MALFSALADSPVLLGIHSLLMLGASFLSGTAALLWIECVAAWLPSRGGQLQQQPPNKNQPQAQKSSEALSPETARPRCAVLVPAHNEATVIEHTLTLIQAQLQSGDRLWVIADNCTDDTAMLARQGGATVLERQNTQQRGKGYALDYGLAQLATAPPEIVVMVDADSQLHPGALEALVQMASTYQRPVQANYTMTAASPSGSAGQPTVPGDIHPSDPSLKDRVTIFATRVKNSVRLQGLSNLGLPCLLTGSGMAFPWSVLQAVDLASGDLVEDMKLGFDLAIAGHPPMFCPDARVTAALPQLEAAAQQQRTRWEHGRFDLTRRYWPKLIAAGLHQGRLGLVILALDLWVLPLSLLVMLWLGNTALCLGFVWATGMGGAAIASGISGGLLLSAIGVSWLRAGREILPPAQLLLIPVFILWKLPIYWRFFTRPERRWVRTDRDAA